MPTKKQLLETRDSTYREPNPAKCCRNCRHYWNHFCAARGACHAVEIRGDIKVKSVCPLAVCDLWEGKES